MKSEQYSELGSYLADMLAQIPTPALAALPDPYDAKDSCLLFMSWISEMAIYCDEREIDGPTANLGHITIALAELVQILEEIGRGRQQVLKKG